MIAAATPIRIHDRQIARRHQADPAGPHAALHGGDRRPRRLHQPVHHVDHRRRVERSGGRCALLEVGSGTERRAVVAHHDHPGGGRLGGVEARRQLGEELSRERVAVVLGIERDRGDPAGQIDANQVTHADRP
jgi:hypothetical protein